MTRSCSYGGDDGKIHVIAMKILNRAEAVITRLGGSIAVEGLRWHDDAMRMMQRGKGGLTCNIVLRDYDDTMK